MILDYLAESLGQFGPADAAERREILRWLLWDNHKLTSYTATYRFLRTFAKDPIPPCSTVFRKRAEAAWSVLDAHLAGRRYVVDDRLTIADLSLVRLPVLRPTRSASTGSSYPRHSSTGSRGYNREPRWVHPYELMPGHPRPAAS